MSIIFKTENENIDYNSLFNLEDDNYFANINDFKYAIDNTRYIVFAYEGEKLVGFARAISEGVETAYIIGAYAKNEDLKYKLIKELEKFLIGKRKMLFANPKDINLYEELGYLRCKNAYTYINFDINDFNGYFLPAGYKFETEFYRKPKDKKIEVKNKEIIYKDNINNLDFNKINDLLTKAFFNRPHDINKTKEAFSNSNYFEAAYDGEKLVGIARAISDGRFSTILNVAVDPDYQGLNIGRKVLLNLSKQLSGQIVFLNTHAGSAGFYNRVIEYRRNKTAFEKGPVDRPFSIDSVSEMFLPKGFRFIDELD